MTLIRINDTGLKGISRDKNRWIEESGQTPNELFNTDTKYRLRAQKYYKVYKSIGLKKPFRWVEIRLIDRPKLVITSRRDWYEDPIFRDKCFWVWQAPVVQEIDGVPYSYHLLEPLECLRVSDERFRKHGIVPKGHPLYIVPVECCHMAWTETSAGYSDHIHHRPEVRKSQKQIEKEAKRAEDSKKLIKLADDFTSTAAGQKALNNAMKLLKVPR